MRNSDIISYWIGKEESTTKFSADSLSKFGFQESTLSVLSTVGLPFQAAPFLSFNQTLAEFQSLDTYFQLEDSTWKRFIIIGADGAGNPIVLDTNTQDEVLLLDHDNDFVALPVTQSLLILLGCLVVYSQFVDELVTSRGSGAYLKANFTDAQFASLREALRTVDSQTVESRGFWHDELVGLLASREFYKKGRDSQHS
jgi:hypothetical protein